jgi:phage terminase small subunit
MAGMKGRSGGARPGAGRKPKPKPEPLPPVDLTPLDYLLSVQNDPNAPTNMRVRAAVAAAQYVHTKKHDGGKKDERADKAKAAAKSSRFKSGPPPSSVVPFNRKP